MKPKQPSHVPEEFSYVEELKNKKHLTVSEITSAYMMASELGHKIHNQSVEIINEAETEEEQTSGSRPSSGILQETLQEIEDSEEAEEEEEEEDTEEEASEDVISYPDNENNDSVV